MTTGKNSPKTSHNYSRKHSAEKWNTSRRYKGQGSCQNQNPTKTNKATKIVCAMMILAYHGGIPSNESGVCLFEHTHHQTQATGLTTSRHNEIRQTCGFGFSDNSPIACTATLNSTKKKQIPCEQINIEVQTQKRKNDA